MKEVKDEAILIAFGQGFSYAKKKIEKDEGMYISDCPHDSGEMKDAWIAGVEEAKAEFDLVYFKPKQ